MSKLDKIKMLNKKCVFEIVLKSDEVLRFNTNHNKAMSILNRFELLDIKHISIL